MLIQPHSSRHERLTKCCFSFTVGKTTRQAVKPAVKQHWSTSGVGWEISLVSHYDPDIDRGWANLL